MKDSVFQFGEFELSSAQRSLRRSGEQIALRPKTFQTLLYLIVNRAHVVTKDELLEALWPDVEVTEGSLTHCIREAREALGDNAQDPSFIRTVPRVGYRFIAETVEAGGNGGGEGDVDAAADDPGRGYSAAVQSAGTLSPKSVYIAWACAAVFGIGCALLGAVLIWAPPSSTETIRFSVPSPKGMPFDLRGADAGPAVLSRDGRQMAFVASGEGENWLYLRRLDSPTPSVVPGSADASFPFWSPDGGSVAFFASGHLKRVDLSTGAVQTLCPAPVGMGGTWNEEGMILFAPDFYSPLHIVPAAGGLAQPILELSVERSEISHRWPWFLPDGEHFLVRVVSSERNRGGIYIGSLSDPDLTKLMEEASNTVFAPPSSLMYVNRGTLMVRGFDPVTFELSEEAVPLADNVSFDPGFSRAAFSVSETGVLAYCQRSRPKRQLAWYDRQGRRLENLGEPDFFEHFSIAPNGRLLALDQRESESRDSDIWIVDLEMGSMTRFTLTPAVDSFPVWSPDNREVFFSSDQGGSLDIYSKAVSNDKPEEKVLAMEDEIRPLSFTRDRRFLLFELTSTSTRSDLWILPTDGKSKPFPFAQTEAGEFPAAFHPGGRWVVYSSDESFRHEIYVEQFPSTGSVRWQVSREGGYQPRWSVDGKELFYVRPDKTLVCVKVEAGNEFKFAPPEVLFKIKVDDLNEIWHYDVTLNGERFLINEVAEESVPEEVAVVVNWQIP